MDGCIFCKVVSGAVPSHKVYEDDSFVAFLDINPVAPGHTLIVTKEHYETIFDLPEYLLEKTTPVTRHIAEAVKRGAAATGINIIMNNGRPAGQLVDHAHIHIIPRHEGDNLIQWPGQPYSGDQAKNVLEKIKKAF